MQQQIKQDLIGDQEALREKKSKYAGTLDSRLWPKLLHVHLKYDVVESTDDCSAFGESDNFGSNRSGDNSVSEEVARAQGHTQCH